MQSTPKHLNPNHCKILQNYKESYKLLKNTMLIPLSCTTLKTTNTSKKCLQIIYTKSNCVFGYWFYFLNKNKLHIIFLSFLLHSQPFLLSVHLQIYFHLPDFHLVFLFVFSSLLVFSFV